ncbi:hypothetical protein [Peribacillus loiseleuriae]|nr:hypothetical protein [Peribacillus loiseleuriae]
MGKFKNDTLLTNDYLLMAENNNIHIAVVEEFEERVLKEGNKKDTKN